MTFEGKVSIAIGLATITSLGIIITMPTEWKAQQRRIKTARAISQCTNELVSHFDRDAAFDYCIDKVTK